LDQVTQRWLQASRHFAVHHRRSIVATAITLLGGFAVTAFGIAPLAPDAALLPQRLVTENVVPDALAPQVEALSDQTLSLRRNDITRGIDTAASLLARLGVNDASAVNFLRNDPTARRLLSGRGGKMVQVSTSEDGQLNELVARYPAEDPKQAKTHFTRMTIARTNGQWLARLETVPLQAQVRLGSGTIRTSLFAATDDALLPDAVGAQLADIFGTEIDFHRELRKGDTFSVVYEALTADGEVVAWNEGAGRVLAAEFVNNGRAHQALWFGGDAGEKSKGGYYGLDGSSKHRSFLASPVAFSRITSGFSMRFHPILKTWKAHLGVDYGAPMGTAVRTVGDGTVEFAGRQNGYGNVIQIKHGNDRSTLYAHLSRIDVHRGEHVEQGETIGAVGMTGWATGPHLHFEFRVHGKHVDPIQVARSSEPVTLDPADRTRFAALSKGLQAQLQLAETTIGTRDQVE
jgi:murein DD-endopeptidase MepM/ murein hydrolase activator NlpD